MGIDIREHGGSFGGESINIPFIAASDFNLYYNPQTPSILDGTHATFSINKDGSLRLSFGTYWSGSTYSINFFVKKNGTTIFSFSQTAITTTKNTFDINVLTGDIITITSSSGYQFGRYLTDLTLSTQYTLPKSISNIEVTI